MANGGVVFFIVDAVIGFGAITFVVFGTVIIGAIIRAPVIVASVVVACVIGASDSIFSMIQWKWFGITTIS